MKFRTVAHSQTFPINVLFFCKYAQKCFFSNEDPQATPVKIRIFIEPKPATEVLTGVEVLAHLMNNSKQFNIVHGNLFPF